MDKITIFSGPKEYTINVYNDNGVYKCMSEEFNQISNIQANSLDEARQHVYNFFRDLNAS